MARKKTSKTDQTEAQDTAAKDAPLPEAETPPTEKPSSDAPKATSVAEAPEQSADLESTAQDATTDQPEPAESTAETDGTPEDTPQEAETDDELTPSPEDDDPMAEVATMAEAEEAQAGQQTDEAETPAPASSPVTKTEQVTIRQGGFWSMLLGGVVAAGIGVIAAPYVLPDHPLRPAEDSVDTTALQDRIDAQETALGDLQSTVEAIPTAPDLSGDVSGLRDTLADLAGR